MLLEYLRNRSGRHTRLAGRCGLPQTKTTTEALASALGFYNTNVPLPQRTMGGERDWPLPSRGRFIFWQARCSNMVGRCDRVGAGWARLGGQG